MKRFSQEIDRQFEFGGEVFKWKQPYWEDYAHMLDKDLADAQAAVNGSEQTPEEQDATVHAAVQGFIKRVEMFLDPEDDSIRRWKALCKRKDNAIAAYQFRDLHTWLIEVTSGSPPTEEPSSDGQSAAEVTSTAGSN